MNDMYIHTSEAKRGRDVHVQCLLSSFSFSPIISRMHPSRCMPRVRTTTHPFSHIIHPFVHLRPPAVPPPQPQLQKCSIFIFICPHSLVPHMYVYAHAGPPHPPKPFTPKLALSLFHLPILSHTNTPAYARSTTTALLSLSRHAQAPTCRAGASSTNNSGIHASRSTLTGSHAPSCHRPRQPIFRRGGCGRRRGCRWC